MWKMTVFASLALLVACTSEPEETVDFDDLGPTSERYKEGMKEDSVKQTKIVDERPKSSIFLGVVDTILSDSRWVKWDTVLYADRFGPKSQEKWFAIGKTDSLVLLRYEFRDSSMTKNAFFNWIDCFGPKCKSYVVGDNIRIPKRNGLIFVGERKLIVIEGNKPINEKLVRTLFLKEAGRKVHPGTPPDAKKENWLYVITIPKSGKTTWKRVEKGEEKPIIRTNENS